jgi:hypothetical protein
MLDKLTDELANIGIAMLSVCIKLYLYIKKKT